MTSLLPEEGEHLTTGWEPELDPADSIVRQAVEAHVSWARALAYAAHGDLLEGEGWVCGRTGHSSPFLNWALVTAPPRDWAPLVQQVVSAYPGDSQALLVSPFPTPDLAPLGVGLVGHPPLMLRPPSTVTTLPGSGLEVGEASSGQRLLDAERVLVEGYPLPDLAGAPPGDFYRPELVGGATKVFVAHDGDDPVATSAAHSAAGVTVVENVAVLPAARGKGAGAAITWAATNAWPGQPAVLIASDDGQPVYERLGFLRLVRWTVWLVP